jgi:hypothetical protein
VQKFETVYVKTETKPNAVFHDRSVIKTATFSKVVAIDPSRIISVIDACEGGDIWYMLECVLVSGNTSSNWHILVNQDFTGYEVAQAFKPAWIEDDVAVPPLVVVKVQPGSLLSNLTFHDRDLLKMVVEDFMGGI